MPNYSTNLKTWGSTGSIYPDGYNYVEGEQPVDAWDNFFNANVISDIDHLVDVTNNDLIAQDGTVPVTGNLPFRTAGFPSGDEWRVVPDPGNTSTDGDEALDIGLWDDSNSSRTDHISINRGGPIEIPNHNLSVGNDIVDSNSNTIWDFSAGHIPQGSLENDAITATAGDGLTGGGSTSLGSSFTFNINVSDFAGRGVEDDGSDNLRVDGSAVDADEFSGSNGTSDQVLKTDGTTASWGDAPLSTVSTEGSTVDNSPDEIDFYGRSVRAVSNGSGGVDIEMSTLSESIAVDNISSRS